MVLGGSSWRVSVRLVIGRSSVRIRPRAPFVLVKGYQARRAHSGGSGGGNLSALIGRRYTFGLAPGSVATTRAQRRKTRDPAHRGAQRQRPMPTRRGPSSADARMLDWSKPPVRPVWGEPGRIVSSG